MPRRRPGRSLSMSLTLLTAFPLTLHAFLSSAPATAASPRISAEDARAYGFTERDISKRLAKLRPPAECSDAASKKLTGHEFFARYRRIEEIETFLKGLAGKHPDLVRIGSAGKSVQGRALWTVSMDLDPQSGHPVALSEHAGSVVLVTAAVHGREWTTTSSVLFTVHELLAKGRQPSPQADPVRVVFVPLVNPDGYAFTFTSEKHRKQKWEKGKLVEESVEARYWRKNRAENADGSLGVDLNRNFGSTSAVWGRDKKSKSIVLTQSDIYQGPAGFSEPETRALRKLALSFGPRLHAFFDVHCCIGAVLEPWYLPSAHVQSELSQAVLQERVERNHRVGERIVAALSEAGKGVRRRVEGGSGAPGEYLWQPRDKKSYGSGISSNWGFNELNVDLTYVVELRGKFVAPCWEIVSLGRETHAGAMTLVREVGLGAWKATPVRLGHSGGVVGLGLAWSRGSGLGSGTVFFMALLCAAVVGYVWALRKAKSRENLKR